MRALQRTMTLLNHGSSVQLCCQVIACSGAERESAGERVKSRAREADTRVVPTGTCAQRVLVLVNVLKPVRVLRPFSFTLHSMLRTEPPAWRRTRTSSVSYDRACDG
eukprot:scaffold219869_cov42-Prasinocladus_malaysianus.AAC.1